MIGARRIVKLALFVIVMAFFYIGIIFRYTVNEALPVRKETRLDSSYNTVKSINYLTRPKKEKPQVQSPLLAQTRESTTLKNSTKERRESQIDVKNIVSESPATNTSLLVDKILRSVKSITHEEVTVMPLCDSNPPDLGPLPLPIEINEIDLKLEKVNKKYPEVNWGGRYFPPNCIARHKVAIIVPYRDRQQHLAIFLTHMHPFLIKQQIEYGIFIIEQAGTKEFNRAKLMNTGFAESQRLKAGGWQCFIFHDVDLLPLDTRNVYSCPKQPRHMSASIDKMNFMLPYPEIFGGVSAMTLEQFTKVNGFSNKYWGWGGEDDDMFYRLEKRNYHIGRYKMPIALYSMVKHEQSNPNEQRSELLSKTKKTYQMDGLSTLEYKLVQVTQYHLYTNILVNIDDKNEMSRASIFARHPQLPRDVYSLGL